MHPDVIRGKDAIWRVVTGTPAGSGAPPRERWVRLLPLLVPLLAAATLAGWDRAWRRPRLEAVRAQHQDVLQLERANSTLAVSYSEQQAAELAATAERLRTELTGTPGELRQRLSVLEQTARAHGWVAQFDVPVPLRPPVEPAATPPVLGHLAVRAHFAPLPGTTDRLGSLLALLDRLPAFQPRIDLIQLAISADERGWQGVDVHLRSSYRISDAKPSQ